MSLNDSIEIVNNTDAPENNQASSNDYINIEINNANKFMNFDLNLNGYDKLEKNACLISIIEKLNQLKLDNKSVKEKNDILTSLTDSYQEYTKYLLPFNKYFDDSKKKKKYVDTC